MYCRPMQGVHVGHCTYNGNRIAQLLLFKLPSKAPEEHYPKRILIALYFAVSDRNKNMFKLRVLHVSVIHITIQ